MSETPTTETLKKGDYYYDDDGKMVLSESFLMRRGYCCQSGCRHCPYGFGDTVDPDVPLELQQKADVSEQARLAELAEKYLDQEDS